MTTDALLLVLLSALGHASWNFYMRKFKGSPMIVWGTYWAGSAFAFLAWLLLYGSAAGLAATNMPGLYIALLSGAIHAAYFYILGQAYRIGEISTVYPLARGSGVAGAAALGIIFLGETVSAGGTSGILLILVGILLTAGFRIGALGAGAKRPALLALLVGITISFYSILDSIGSGHIPPLLYLGYTNLISAAMLTPLMLTRFRDQIMSTWRQQTGVSIFIGIASTATYILVLIAFRMGPVSYVVAVREFAIIIGVLLGVLILGEKITRSRVIGIAAIVTGIVLIRLSG